MAVVLAGKASRTIESVRAVRNGIAIVFADGCKGTIPYRDIPEIKDRSNLASAQIHSRYEFELTDTQGRVTEIPWDFARHYCDPSYATQIGDVAARGRLTMGLRIRKLREAANLTQEQLAKAAGIGRVTLVRLEGAEQSPRYETLVAIAQALNRPVSQLLVAAPG